jgi:hypothetical protein
MADNIKRYDIISKLWVGGIWCKIIKRDNYIAQHRAIYIKPWNDFNILLE